VRNSIIYQFYFTYAGFTNLLAFNPFSNPKPNPLILPLPTVPTVYVLPVNILSLPILKSRQLSRFRSFTCFLLSFDEINIGDYPTMSTLSIDYAKASSCSSSSYLK